MEQTNPLPNPEPIIADDTPKQSFFSAKNIGLVVLFSLFLIIIASLSTYFLLKSQNSPTPSPTPVDETINWKTYKNQDLLFSIKYPDSLNPSVIGDGVSFSDNPTRALLYVSMITGNNPKNLTAEEWLKDPQQSQLRAGLSPKMQVSPLQQNGLSGIRLDNVDNLEGYKDFKAIFIKENLVIILNFGPKEDQIDLANQILSTFKFLDQKPQLSTESTYVDASKNAIWETYSSPEAGFSLKYASNVKLVNNKLLYDNFSPNSDESPLTLNITLRKLDTLVQERPFDYTKEDAIEDRAILQRGEVGKVFDWPVTNSIRLINIGKINAKEYIVFGRFDTCTGVTFERWLVFYQNNYQVLIKLSANKENIILSNPEYFDIPSSPNALSCWKNPEPEPGLYENLKTRNVSRQLLDWYDTFDLIVKSITLN